MSQFIPTFSASRSACGGCALHCATARSARPGMYGLHGRAISQDSVSGWSPESSREAESHGILLAMGGRAQGEVLGSVRVLLVEDERASAMVVEQHLAAIRSVQCRTQIATTLAEALERLSRERYDLVIALAGEPLECFRERRRDLRAALDRPD